MKEFLKNTVGGMLTGLARRRLKRLSPLIIGVTGSVGKTSTKEAIYTILQTRYRVIRNEKSYNTDFGLPLAVLEQPSGFSSPGQWFKILWRGAGKALWGGHTLQMMVLEMGVDKPGDMDKLLKLVRPQIAVMTAIKPVHLAEGQFKSLDDIFREKRKLVYALPEKGTAILNADDPYILTLREKLTCKKIFYGTAEWADLRVLEVFNTIEGIKFTICYRNEVVSATLPLLGKFQTGVILPAVAVALTQGFSLQEAVDSLRDYHLPPGRMNLIAGLQGSTIIDSSYNASPETVKAALDLLAELQATGQERKIAVLGSMNELGQLAEYYHREVGKYALGKANTVVTIGEQAEWIADEIKQQGQEVAHFDDPVAAANFLKPLLQKGDMILVKGSQNKVRLEKLVRLLMQDPGAAERLLVRQEKEWQKVN